MPDSNKWNLIINYRDGLLFNCAWTQLPDNGLTSSEQAAWNTYRETLQGILFAFTSPDDVVFPEPPTMTVMPPTAEQLAARAKRKAAFGNAKKVVEIYNLTQSQAAEWLERQAHSGKRKADLLAEINNASDVAGLKQPLRELAEMLYQTAEADKKIIRLLVSLKDKIL